MLIQMVLRSVINIHDPDAKAYQLIGELAINYLKFYMVSDSVTYSVIPVNPTP